MTVQIERVSDDELERLAEEGGWFNIEACVVEELRERRAKDHQVYAFRVGNYYFTGPVPDARTEVALLDFAEAEED